MDIYGHPLIIELTSAWGRIEDCIVPLQVILNLSSDPESWKEERFSLAR